MKCPKCGYNEELTVESLGKDLEELEKEMKSNHKRLKIMNINSDLFNKGIITEVEDKNLEFKSFLKKYRDHIDDINFLSYKIFGWITFSEAAELTKDKKALNQVI